MLFRDRIDAGQKLGERLEFLKGEPNVLVLGVPRGGVVVAAEVARALDAPLDIFIAHKIGAPSNPELAMGAITSAGDVWLDADIVRELRLSEEEIARGVTREQGEIARRLAVFRKERAPLDVKNKILVLVDDGVATGATVLVALRALRKLDLARLILAVPVGPVDTLRQLACECDHVVALATPFPFWAVGRFYAQFDQTTDEQVIAILDTRLQHRTDA